MTVDVAATWIHLALSTVLKEFHSWCIREHSLVNDQFTSLEVWLHNLNILTPMPPGRDNQIMLIGMNFRVALVKN